MTEQPVFLMTPPRKDWGLFGRTNARSRTAPQADAVAAREEWASLADEIVAAGGEVLVMPPNPDANLTGMIYTAEAGEFSEDPQRGPTWILPTMSGAHRIPEAAWIGPFMQELGMETRTIEPVWEAQGDVIRTRDGRAVHTWGTGPAQRTEARAYAQVADLLGHKHLHLEFVADPWFHGNTFLAIFGRPDHQVVLVHEAGLAPGASAALHAFLPDAHFVDLSRDECFAGDTNAIQVNDTLIALDGFSEKSATAIADAGLELERVDLPELFGKGGGAPACLTNRLWGFDAQRLPTEHRWSYHPSIALHTEV